jgi:ubiquinone/menaquinone biosynthesis C-methylase UbiE
LSSLDIGCGYGEGHVKRGEIGIDVKRGLCDVQASAYFLPFRDNCFKEVIMSHILEHLIECKDALREARRVLDKGGRLIIEVPSPYNFNVFKDIILKKHHNESIEHVFAFGENELRNLLEKLEFEVTRVRYVSSSLTEKKLRNTVFFKKVIYVLIWRIYPKLRTAVRLECKIE